MITTLEKAKLILGILTDSKDDFIEAMIPLVEEDYLSIRNTPFDVVDEVTVYPTGSELTAIKMIGYHLTTQGQAGIQSESLSRHSITFQTGGVGAGALYPSSIIASIKRYVSFV